jgi:hypothetical protein
LELCGHGARCQIKKIIEGYVNQYQTLKSLLTRRVHTTIQGQKQKLAHARKTQARLAATLRLGRFYSSLQHGRKGGSDPETNSNAWSLDPIRSQRRN